MPLGIEHSHPGRTADHVDDIQSSGSRLEVLNGPARNLVLPTLALLNDDLRLVQIDLARGSFFVPEMRQGETQNFAPRSTLVREHIKNVIRSYSGGNNLIFKVSNLCPLSRGVHQKGLILAAVAILH